MDAQLENRFAQLERRVADLERQVAALCAAPDEAAAPGGMLPEVVALAREGNLLAAIKLHREATGLGLAEAKAEVEAAIGR